ncbi:DUF421 domain-containing protein [Euzebya tangerina]|uniref:DUF421 domain-containing protein n=1 Tax=Euzebya tangerina TaxID=591198 RepID=UPI000E30EF39|nr:YetF domain-containing protein [Euzebya tangerina]
MTIPELLGSSWSQLAAVVIATVGVFAAIIAATRLLGLRSFAKMSSFDFAATVAIGSIFAATATGSASLAAGALAVAVVYASQGIIAKLRHRPPGAVFDNTPTMLMVEGELLRDNLRRSGVTEADVMAKLREANVLRMEQVRYVILEATGDVSVLHSDGPDATVDQELIGGVAGMETIDRR